jgi:hypothetical protein
MNSMPNQLSMPREAMGVMAFQEQGLGQVRLDAAIFGTVFHGVAGALLIRYAITAPEDESGAFITAAWAAGVYSMFRGMALLQETFQPSPPAQ